MVRLPSILKNSEEYQYIPSSLSPSLSEAGSSAPRRSTRERHAPERYDYNDYRATQKMSRAMKQAFVYAAKVSAEPTSHFEAMKSPDVQKRKKAKQEELKALSLART